MDKTAVPLTSAGAVSAQQSNQQSKWWNYISKILRPTGVKVTSPEDIRDPRKPATTSYDEWRKLYLPGVSSDLIERQRRYARKNRENTALQYGLLYNATNGAQVILPYASNGEPTRVDPYLWRKARVFWPYKNNRILIGNTEPAPPPPGEVGGMLSSVSLPETVVSPAVLGFGAGDVPKPEDVKEELRHIMRPWQDVNPLSIMVHEGLHPRNYPYNQDPVKKGVQIIEGTDPRELEVRYPSQGLHASPGTTYHSLVPYAPGWKTPAIPGLYVKRPEVKDNPVDYYGGGFYSPRLQYFTGVNLDARRNEAHRSSRDAETLREKIQEIENYDYTSEAGTGTAQLVANEMVASKDFPRSFSHLLDMAKRRGALTVDSNGQLHIDQKKFFPRPDRINAMSSGIDDFIELENLYRRAERDYKNSFPGIYVDNHTGTPNVHWVMPWESFRGDFANKIMNRMARENAMKYRANMDQLIGGAFL